jgi:hypothetical protein
MKNLNLAFVLPPCLPLLYSSREQPPFYKDNAVKKILFTPTRLLTFKGIASRDFEISF